MRPAAARESDGVVSVPYCGRHCTAAAAAASGGRGFAAMLGMLARGMRPRQCRQLLSDQSCQPATCLAAFFDESALLWCVKVGVGL
jgi:hypothetical protein